MNEHDLGFWEGIADTARGRGHLRFVLQPLIAIFFGARLGIADAKEGKEPFLWRLFATARHRGRLVREAVSDIAIPFLFAIVLDGILQYYALGYVRPLAAIVVGTALIWLPFSISRALTNRFYRRVERRRVATQT